MGLTNSDWIRLSALIANVFMTVVLFFILWKIIKKPKGPIVSIHNIRIDPKKSFKPKLDDAKSPCIVRVLYNRTNFGDRAGYYSYNVKIIDPRFPDEEFIVKHNTEEITGLLHPGQYEHNCPIMFNDLLNKFKHYEELTIRIEGNYFNTAKGDYDEIKEEEIIPFITDKTDEVLPIEM